MFRTKIEITKIEAVGDSTWHVSLRLYPSRLRTRISGWRAGEYVARGDIHGWWLLTDKTEFRASSGISRHLDRHVLEFAAKRIRELQGHLEFERKKQKRA